MIDQCTFRFSGGAGSIIYTSGTTGKPKGTLIDHRNVVRLMFHHGYLFDFNQEDVWTMFHSYCFDFSVWEMYGALLYGGKLILISKMIAKNPQQFLEILIAEKVTVLNQTPVAFYNLVIQELKSSEKKLQLKYVIFGGEALKPGKLKQWHEKYPETKLINMFGITETTVHVTYKELGDKDIELNTINIGKPIPTLSTYVMNTDLKLQPVGVMGELCVGGEGVGRGYLNRLELTKEKFVTNPYIPGERLYRSGDLGRVLMNGETEYLGRIDHQVKIRGFRIELAEIENRLLKHKDIKEAVVVIRDHQQRDDKTLCAYVVLEPSGPAKELVVSELKDYLSQWLPDYMIPAYFVKIEEIPLTTSGKLDRKALPAPEITPESEYVAPGDEKEKLLADIWSELLNIERVGIHDNFFAVGGDSISSILVISQAQEKGLNISTQQLFQYPTIAELVKNIKETDNEKDKAVLFDVSKPFGLISNEDREKLPEGVEDAFPLRMLQADFLMQNELIHGSSMFHYISSFRPKASFNREKFEQLIKWLVKRHPIFRTSYDLQNFSQYLQLVYSEVPLPLEIEDLRGLSLEKQEEILKQAREDELSRYLDGQKSGLIRFIIHILDDETFNCIFSFHNSVMDGWSNMLLLTELFTTYNLLLKGSEIPVETRLNASLKDLVALELEMMSSEEAKKFWSEFLAGSPMIKLPRQTRTSSSRGSIQARTYTVNLSSHLSAKLKETAASLNVPLKNLLLATHCVVMGIITRNSDIVTGYEVNARPEKKDGDRAVGLFVNVIPFRLQLSRGTWADLIQTTYKTEINLLPYRRYPLAQIKADRRKRQIFEVVFNYTHFREYRSVEDYDGVDLSGTDLVPPQEYVLRAEFGMNALTDEVEFYLYYHANIFPKEQLESFADCYVRVLELISDNPSGPFDLQSLLPGKQ